MKKALLSIEAIVLLGPISLALFYATTLTLIIGIPASINQQFNDDVTYDYFLPVSAIGNIAGDFAIVVLWVIAIKTIRGRVYLFTMTFYAALVAGVLASASLLYIYKWPGLLFGVLPVTVAAIHFVYLQKTMQTHA